MYGLVNRAIEELVTERIGRAGWNAVLDRAGLEMAGFVSLRAYPDHVTYDLVGAASHVLQCTGSEFLHSLGRHWILFTAQEDYGSLITSGGRDLRDFLLHLDSMHARLGLTMPELVPPSFVVEEQPENVLHVHYYSQREGLSPMLIGLLEGVAEIFETPVDVSQVRERTAPSDCDVFAVVPCKSLGTR